jgi:catechol 2,3-dioxygenase-like lactoylglutathione lyase family enzyme
VLGEHSIMPLVAVSDLGRARDFYCGVLGLPDAGADDFALTVLCAGQPMRLTFVDRPVVSPAAILAWRVPDVVAAVRDLAARGVAFTRYDGMDQDADGIWTVPGGGARIAWFPDPDGHVLSLAQY